MIEAEQAREAEDDVLGLHRASGCLGSFRPCGIPFVLALKKSSIRQCPGESKGSVSAATHAMGLVCEHDQCVTALELGEWEDCSDEAWAGPGSTVSALGMVVAMPKDASMGR